MRYQLMSWREVIRMAMEKYPSSVNLRENVKEIISITNASELSEEDLIQLALHIGLKIYPRDRTFQDYLRSSKKVITGLPNNWVPSLNGEYFSLAYHNPEDLFEYLAVVPSAPGGLPYIIHHTAEATIDPNWFNQVVPILYKISLEDNPNAKIGKAFKDQNLTLGQINTINHFFKADPILKIADICTRCYKVSLPRTGFGVRYLYKGAIVNVPPQGIIKEIRFSARKPQSPFKHCQRPYVTELVIARANTPVETKNGLQLTNANAEILTMIDPSAGTHRFSDYDTRPEIHIDAKIYDFDKLTLRVPVCHCTM